MKNTIIAWGAAIAAASFLAATPASAETIELTAGFSQLTRSGVSGGTQNSNNCGYIAGEANYELELSEDFPMLTLSVSGGGDPTLLVYGNGDAPFCASEHTGYWEAGTYSVYVGDRAGSGLENRYSLSISERP